MNATERQALREKHRPFSGQNPDRWANCVECSSKVGSMWGGIAYPCEVSKVLDAWEAEHEAIAKLPEEVTDEEYSPAYAQGYRVAIQAVMSITQPEPVSKTDPKLLDPPTSGTSEPLDPPVSECNHWVYVSPDGYDTLTLLSKLDETTFASELWFTYCPKCGEKL